MQGAIESLSNAQIEARKQMVEDLTKRFDLLKSKVKENGDMVVVKQSVFATIRAGSVYQLEQFLQSGLFSVNERDYQQCSPLHVAAFEGREDMVGVLIAHGADVFAVDKKGRTAKDVADIHRHSSISKKLLGLMSDQRGVGLVEEEESVLHSPFASHSELMPIHATSGAAGLITSEGGPSPLMSNNNINNSNNMCPPHELKPSHYCTVSDDHSLILCLVGLPGRGKSFISRRLARYLNWKGVPCKVFNVGDYRRRFLGATGTSSAEFFDPTNRAAKDAREKMAEFATEDLLDFIHSHPICVGILDATNTTRERRAHLLERFKPVTSQHFLLKPTCTQEYHEQQPQGEQQNSDGTELPKAAVTTTPAGASGEDDLSIPSSFQGEQGDGVDAFDVQPRALTTPVRVVFVESICHNEDIITENILRAKCGNDDFKGVSPQTVIAEFRERIHQYEKVYETLDPSESNGRVSFIQIIDAKQRIILHNVKGALPSRVSYFLMSLHPVAYPVFVCLPAETAADVAGQFGGDTRITANGIDYVYRLRSFIKARMTAKTGNGSLRLLCSYSPAVEQTVRLVLNGVHAGDEELDLVTIPLRALDDINYGAMAGLTVEEARQRHPKTSALLFLQDAQPTSSSTSSVPPSFVAIPPLTHHESRESQPDVCQNDCPPMPTFAYTVSFVRGGESTRQVNVRLEPALLEIMRADGPVIVIADPTPAKGVLAFITDEMPEHNQKMYIPRHGVVEVGVKCNKVVHQL